MTGHRLTRGLRGSASVRALVIALGAQVVTAPLSAAFAGSALPTAGHYVAGTGAIAKKGANGLTINQSSNTGIVDWSSFSIGKGNSVQFNNGAGATLNRVTGGDLSNIAGSLKATGSLYLINPQGVIVSSSGTVVTGGSFVASSRDETDSDFTNGRRRFSGTSKGNVANAGTIKSANGDVALIGRSVSNSGTMSAKNGTASLDAGSQVLLAPSGSRILVNGGNGSSTNSGTLQGAQAQINAAGGNVYALAGNNGGIVRATGTKTVDGHVWLTSGTGNVTVDGKVASSGSDNVGGVVDVAANNVTVTKAAQVTATGRTGSAVNLIGAAKTSIAGKISAGGKHGGGKIETSGGKLEVAGKVTAGKGGQWLLDPVNLTVDSGAATTIAAALNGGSSVTLKTGAASASSGGHGGTSSSGAGDILVEASITWSGHSAILTLDAYNNVDIDATIGVSGNSGGVNIVYGDTSENGTHANGMGALNFGAAGNVAFNGFTSNTTPLSINGQAYKIENTIADLAAAITGNHSGFYALANNIDASGTTYGADPVLTTFDGTFEGLGNTITGLKIHSTAVGSDVNVGLFTEADGKIADLHLANVSITSGPNTGSNLSYVGSVAAYGSGTISNVSVTGNITGGTNSRLGGIIGANYGTISKTTSSANITNGSGAETGGLAGMNSGGTLIDDVVTGNITSAVNAIRMGGLAGYSTGTITNSHATGNISSGPSSSDIGGLVGQLDGGSITNSYATGNVTGGTYIGGIVGDADHGTISGSHASGAVNALSQFAGGLVGLSNIAIDSSYATGNVTGNNIVGGLVGENEGTITNSHASGVVTGTMGGGGDVASAAMFGGLVGDNDSSISTSYATGQVIVGTSGSPLDWVAVGGLVGANTNTGATIDSSWSTAGVTVFANHAQVGGLVGTNSQAVTNSWGGGTLSLTGANGQMGGLIGTNSGAVQYDYAIADMTLAGASGELGGLVGDDSGTIDNTYASGSLLGSGSGTKVGGLVGNEAMLTNITNSYFDTGSTGYTSGIGGSMNTAGAVAISDQSSTNNSYAQSTYGNFNFNSSTGHWVMIDGDTRPMLIAEESDTITNGHQLQLAAVNLDHDYTLAGDIDLRGDYSASDVWDSSQGFSPIGTLMNGFTGSLEGAGYTITGMSIHRATSEVGLFGAIGNTAVLDNVRLENSGTDSVDGISDVGGLVGYAHGGTITNSYSKVAVSGRGNIGGLVGISSADISNSYAAAPVDGGGTATQVGGLVGENSGSITDSYASGFVLHGGDDSGGLVGNNHSGSITGSYASGQVRGQNSTGGLVGLNEASGSITDSYASGNVVGNNNVGGLIGFMNGGSAFSSYSLGMVTGSVDLGGVTGNLGSGTFTNVYWDTETSGYGVHNGVGNVFDATGMTGKTTAQLQSALQAGFSANTWSVDAASPGTAFAYLKWQYPAGFLPQTLSGTVLTGLNGSAIQNAHIKLLNNGAGFGEEYTYANGYYYMPEAPVGSSDQVLAYITQGSRGNALVQGNQLGPDASEPGSLTGVDIYAGWVDEITRESTLSAVSADLVTAAGGTNSDYLFDGSTGELLSGVNLRLKSNGTTLNIDKDLDLSTETLVIDAAHNVTQTHAIDAQNMLLTGNGTINLSGTGNSIGTLAASGQLSMLVSSGSINVGTVGDVSGISAGGAVTLTSTSGNIALGQNVTSAQTLSLNSAGTISETAPAVITASILKGSSVGATTLGGANVIASLGPFTTGGNAAFALTDASDLTLSGALNTGKGTVTLKTTGTGHDIVLKSALTGGTVSLISAGTLAEQTANGKITATILNGSSVGATSLGGGNVITALGPFTASGNGAFVLTDASDLTLGGALKTGKGAVALKTTGKGHDIVLKSTLTGGTVSLISAGTLTEKTANGKITATILKGSSAGATSLGGANVIASLGPFTASGNGAFVLTDASDLTLGGALNTGKGAVALKTTGAGHDIVLKSTLTGGAVSLISAGTLTEKTANGKIIAASLKGSSVGGAAMGGANSVTTLGGFTNSGAGNLAFANAKALSVAGTVSAAASNAVLTLIAAGNLSLSGVVKSHTVTLKATAGKATQTAKSAITTKLLNVTAKTGINLIGANHITAVGTRTTASGPNVIHGVGL